MIRYVQAPLNRQGKGLPMPARRRRAGQNLIEFALIVPILIALLMGIMEFGWVMRNQLILTNAAREGARALSVGGSSAAVRTRLAEVLGGNLIANGTITITYWEQPASGQPNYFSYPINDATFKNTIPGNNIVSFRVTIRHKQITGFFPFLNRKPLQAVVMTRREIN